MSSEYEHNTTAAVPEQASDGPVTRTQSAAEAAEAADGLIALQRSSSNYDEAKLMLESILRQHPHMEHVVSGNEWPKLAELWMACAPLTMLFA